MLFAQVPAFSKGFFPDTIGPGSTTSLVFTISNVEAQAPVSDLAFTDTLPPGVAIATPAGASTDCGGGVLSAPAGGATIALSGAVLGPGGSCTVTVNVVGNVPGLHTNVSGELTSSAGSGGTAGAMLVVDTARPGFSKSFAPGSVPLGGTSTLTLTIDNSSNADPADSLSFSDTLPSGMVVAAPANAVTDCPLALLTAVAGTNVISFNSFSGVPAGATCSVVVDVTTTTTGIFPNTTLPLYYGIGGDSAGFATAALDVPVEFLVKTFTDDPVAPGGTVTLRFTITNLDRDNPASAVAFDDELDPLGPLTGLAPGEALPKPACGGTLDFSAGTLSLTGGSLPAGGSCTFSVLLDVPAAAPAGVFANTTDPITAEIGGDVVVGNAARDNLVVSTAPRLTKEFVDDPAVAGGAVTLRFTIANPDPGSALGDISFTDDLNTAIPGLAAGGLVVGGAPAPLDDVCGAGSQLTVENPFPPFIPPDPTRLVFTGGSLAAAGSAGDSCSFDVVLDVPADAPAGTHHNTSSELAATAEFGAVAGEPASGGLVVVAAPRLTKAFTGGPAVPGATVNLQFTLAHAPEAPGAADGITFTDDLAATGIAGLAAVGLPLADVCGTGSQIAGTTSLTFTGGSLAPGDACTFSVTLAVPAGALPGIYSNTTSNVVATVAGLPGTSGAAAAADLRIAGLVMTKEFVDDPVPPGGTATLRFTIDNVHPLADASAIAFLDNLAAELAGLTALLPPSPDPPCGAGSALAGAAGDTFLLFSGGTLAAGTSCTFDVTVQVPAGAAPSSYRNTTSGFTAVQGGGPVAFPNATDVLVVDDSFITLAKSFTDDPVAPGGTVTLQFTLGNLHPTATITDASFTDDLAAVVPGLTALLPPSPDPPCGPGSALAGAAGDTHLTLSGGNLAAGASCTFSVALQVPGGTPAGIFRNTTSPATGVLGGFPVTGDPASDDLRVEALSFTKAFGGPAGAGGATTLSFTITNLDPASPVGNLSFSDDLDATLAGLAATGLPAGAVCGAGSVLSGTTLLAMNGGSLPPGGSCTIIVPLQVPVAAAPGAHLNTTSYLTQSGLRVASPASATLTIAPPPTASTEAASGVDTTSATLNGTVNANGFSSAVTFEYGPDTGYGTTVAASPSPVAGSAPTPVSAALTGLAPATTYHYRTVAQSLGGISYGADRSFTTHSADLSIRKTGRAATATVGDVVTYDILVSNAGPATAENVAVVDTLPPEVSFLSATADQGGCGAVAGVVTCLPGTIPAGAEVGITLMTRAESEGVALNVASVSAGSPDPVAGNNQDTAATTIEPFLPLMYFSFASGGRVGGVRFADEDVLAFDSATGTWAMYFDGSDVGLATTDVNGFHLMEDGSMLLSFAEPLRLAGLGLVAPNDVVRFVPTSTGADTAGTFEWFLDGSDVGLTRLWERLNAISRTPDGRLLVSTRGPYRVPGLPHGRNEDLLALNEAVYGADSAGAWELYFDGSDVRLNDGFREDPRGVSVDASNGDIYFTTRGRIILPGLAAWGNNVVRCRPLSLGPDTQCEFDLFWRNRYRSLRYRYIDALFIQR